MVRVAVFEDSPKIREVLEMVIQDCEKLLLVGSFNNAQNVLDKVRKSKPDVILMDIKMPEVSGVEAVKEIKSILPNIQIIMQTIFDEDDKIFAAICAGASGYVLKGTPPEKIIEAIIEANEGGSPMSPSIARKVLTIFQNNFNITKAEFIDLTAREKEILSFLVKGKSYKMIADECFVSITTICTHIRHIYEKLHVNSVSEAVVKALEMKLVK